MLAAAERARDTATVTILDDDTAGVTGYTITGLRNGVATGVFVRSFTGAGHSERGRRVQPVGADQGRRHHAQGRLGSVDISCHSCKC